MSEQQWNDVKAHIAQNQAGVTGYPSDWLIGKMALDLECYPLRFSGEDYGYLFWMRPQDARIRKGMRTLKGALQEFDQEIELRMKAETRVRELEAMLQSPSPKPVAVKPVAPKAESSESEKGEAEYRARAAGSPWKDIGGNTATVNAKRYALKHGLAWPPA